MKLGYIGLGLMGRPCALNLIKGGHTLFVWARRPTSAKEVVEKGATFCDSIAETASKCEILFTNVTNTEDVQDVLFGAAGVVASGNRGLTIVDMSTISATATRNMGKRLEAHGMELVDAPVSGGTAGAKDGTLTIMVGAKEETFERIMPVLACMGKSITRIGDIGAGQVAKSCNQIVITGAIAAVAEAILFAEKAGVDPVPVRTALLGGFARSKILELHGQRMIEDNYAPGFKTVLHLKDIGIVNDIAKELGLRMPVTQVGCGLLQRTVEAGFGELDSASLFKVTE
jgi:2-hydroxy-3-oxopropionate reductase